MAFGLYFTGTVKTQVTCRINLHEKIIVFFIAGWYISLPYFYIPM